MARSSGESPLPTNTTGRFTYASKRSRPTHCNIRPLTIFAMVTAVVCSAKTASIFGLMARGRRSWRSSDSRTWMNGSSRAHLPWNNPGNEGVPPSTRPGRPRSQRVPCASAQRRPLRILPMRSTLALAALATVFVPVGTRAGVIAGTMTGASFCSPGTTAFRCLA